MATIKFPIEVSGVEFSKSEYYRDSTLSGAKCGDLVSVRSCAPEDGDKTYLGIMIGEFPLGTMCSFDKETNKLTIGPTMSNPAMFVPDLRKIVWGCGSFWRKIKTVEELREITTEDIDNTWYIKALRESSFAPAEQERNRSQK